ncbi:MAG: SufS family cysteine desulfurase [Candidatus Woesebacteria bacterium]
MFDPQEVRKGFPILSISHSSGKPLVYLDSAATSQKPEVVIDAISNYYKTSNANVHRGIHYLGDKSTRAWHDSRSTIATFFGAEPEELIMVRNTTEALNLVAYNLEEKIGQGDLILATQMEHHSNLVPWQELAKRTKATLGLIPVTEEGMLDLDWLEEKIRREGDNIKILALAHVSNTLGTVNPISKIKNLFKKLPFIVVDGAQAAPHMSVNFHALGVDFYAVSAHKMLGPMGVGGLFVKKEILKTMKPWLFGGGMIDEVEEGSATFSEDLEDKFTAGTPDVAGAVGWAAACQYLSALHMNDVFTHDEELIRYTLDKLTAIPEITVVGPMKNRSGSVSFLYKGIHSHDVAQILDSEGIAVRSGHHCTMPLHHAMHWVATTRVSFNVYTTKADIDTLVVALEKVKKVFHG